MFRGAPYSSSLLIQTCFQTEQKTLELDIGSYTGEVDTEGLPSGQGTLTFKPDDPMGRLTYEGSWVEGVKTGSGKMTFASGDLYEGSFLEGVPHGKGQFKYADGQVESATFEDGARQGLSR